MSQKYIDIKRLSRREIGCLLLDIIPLACKGNDYGIFGNEALVSSAQGRAYGVELLAKWQVPDRINASASLTLYQSEYRNDKDSPYLPSAWDNR